MHLKPSIETMIFNTNHLKTRIVLGQNNIYSDILKWSSQ